MGSPGKSRDVSGGDTPKGKRPAPPRQESNTKSPRSPGGSLAAKGLRAKLGATKQLPDSMNPIIGLVSEAQKRREEVRNKLPKGFGPQELTKPDMLGRMPMGIAVCEQQGHLVPFLLERKANINDGDNQGDTALMLAAERGLRDAVELLIAGGARMGQTNNSGFRALDVAQGKEVSHYLQRMTVLAMARLPINRDFQMRAAIKAPQVDEKVGSQRFLFENLPAQLTEEHMQAYVKKLVRRSRLPRPDRVETLMDGVRGHTVTYALVDFDDLVAAEAVIREGLHHDDFEVRVRPWGGRAWVEPDEAAEKVKLAVRHRHVHLLYAWHTIARVLRLWPAEPGYRSSSSSSKAGRTSRAWPEKSLDSG